MPPVNEQEKLVGRKVADAVKAVSHSGLPRYLGFFNLREAELALAECKRSKWREYVFYGGFEGAERTLLCLYNPNDAAAALPQNYPLAALKITPANAENTALTHRDYLGAILGAGVKRECIGDIVTDAGGATVVLQPAMLPFLLQQLTRIGRVSVALQKCELPAGTRQTQGLPKMASVSSLRADAVLAAMLHINRAQAAQLIEKGTIQINHLVVQSRHYSVCEGDIFSVRGTGKFCLSKVGGKSKKDRTFVEFVMYS